MTARLVETAAAVLPRAGSAADAAFHPGDVATLVVRASWEGDGAVAWPGKDELEKALQGKASVLSEAGPAPADAASVSAPSPAQDARAWTVQLLLAPGDQQLPDIPMALQPADGGAPERASVPGPSLTLSTVLDERAAQQIEAAAQDPQAMKAEAAQQLAPARGPWELAPRMPWWGWLLIALAAASLVAWILHRWRSRRAKTPEKAAPQEPAEVVARRRLRELRESALLTTGRHLEFHVALADILKQYLERRLHVELRERTTDEIRRELQGAARSKRFVAEVRQDTLAVLDGCDMVKFAKAVPVPSEALALVEVVDRLVTRTTESAAPAPGPSREAA